MGADTQVWSDVYDREMDDVFQIQSDIARQIVQQLGVTLGTSAKQAVETRPTDNFQAYQAFLRGLRLQRDHKRLRREIRALGIRRRPVLRFLGRANPINVFLGRLRSRQTRNGSDARQSNRQHQSDPRARAPRRSTSRQPGVTRVVAHRSRAR